MEFSFEIPDWMDPFLEEPGLIVAWAAFGVSLSMLAFSLATGWIIKKLKSRFVDKVMQLLGVVFLVTWLVGFVMTILMLFGGVHPVKMILCWMLLLIVVTIFCVMEHRLVLKKIDSMPEVSLAKKSKK